MAKEYSNKISITDRGKEDFDLLDRFISKGDQLAFKKLMDKHKQPIYFVILKLVRLPEDAEDLTLEVFAKAYEQLHSFNHSNAFSTWIYKMATNHAIDFLRKKKLETSSIEQTYLHDSDEKVEINIKDDSINAIDALMQHQDAMIIMNALNRLSPKYKEVLEMRFYDDLSYEEIAAKANIPIGTVKTNLNRAKSMFEKIITTTTNTYNDKKIVVKKLKYDGEYEIGVIGIVSSVKDYSLASVLAEKLSLDFLLADPYKIEDKEEREILEYTRYIASHNDEVHYQLLVNDTLINHLFKKTKDFQFFLFYKKEIDFDIQEIKELDQVILCVELQLSTLPHYTIVWEDGL
jgi:RNA polymerase sigma factor (sigma-70 family)